MFRVNALLAALLVCLVGYLVALLLVGPAALPVTTPAEHTVQTYQQVRSAVRQEVIDFLHVDYQDMEPLSAKVLAGATGPFRKQYAGKRADLESAARAAKATSHGTVRTIGISALTGDHTGDKATVLVAADSVVHNRASAHAESTPGCPHQGALCRFHRFRIELTRTTEGWKVSRLGFVS